MANYAKMELINSIQVLYKKKWSQRRIARELGVHRCTVRRYIEELESKCTNPTAGNEEVECSKCTKPDRRESAGPPSACSPWTEQIKSSLEKGLSAQRIYQDLCSESGFTASYESVKRYVRGLRKQDPKRFERVEVLPGMEAQVDFGTGNWIHDASGKKKRAHVFRVVLGHSRKGYTEMVFRQDTETFLRCLENTFRYFGGVPETLVIDNLKAAIPRADWYDPEVHPKLRDFAEYYGVAILPTKPYHPHHKGKVERGVDYVKENALKARSFQSLAEANAHLLYWEEHVADCRIHGTTRKQVARQFAEIEAPTLHALPAMPFPAYQEGRRVVHRDGYVEVQKSYYEAPPEYVGRTLWVRWAGRTVRLLNHQMEELRVHARAEPGKFVSTPGGRNPYKTDHSAKHLLKAAQKIGPGCGQWAAQLVHKRGREAYRPLLGLQNMSRTHAAADIDRACETALSYGAMRLKDIRRLIEQPTDPQQELAFLQEHPLIRDLGEYQAHITPKTEGKAC
jgi:transposase